MRTILRTSLFADVKNRFRRGRRASGATRVDQYAATTEHSKVGDAIF